MKNNISLSIQPFNIATIPNGDAFHSKCERLSGHFTFLSLCSQTKFRESTSGAMVMIQLSEMYVRKLFLENLILRFKDGLCFSDRIMNFGCFKYF